MSNLFDTVVDLSGIDLSMNDISLNTIQVK